MDKATRRLRDMKYATAVSGLLACILPLWFGMNVGFAGGQSCGATKVRVASWRSIW